jgi:hypothetical protein
MSSNLPKGHLSCLSNAFRYTPALRTNIAETFARIRRELQNRDANAAAAQEAPVVVRVGRHFSRETIERAVRILHAGGLHSAPRLVHSGDL